MIKLIRLFFGLLVVFSLSSWGFFAHKQINKLAIFTLPAEIAPFYKKNIRYITEHAVDPDKRRYANDYEAARHYMDVDAFGTYPFDSIPKRWIAAEKKYSVDTLNSRGIVPWQIERSYKQLVKAFVDLQPDQILRHSADIGHYIADAHVPLHTTHNYNGQLTNQIGIHAFWESRLPELFTENYDFLVGRASYIDDPLRAAWQMVEESFALVDSVLEIEVSLSNRFAKENKYGYESRSGNIERVYSRPYAKAYHEQLNGMVEKQMRKSIRAVGSFWYSAWIDAGQPDLATLMRQRIDMPIDSLQGPSPSQQKALGREEWQ